MSDFINTIDLLGDDVVCDSLIDGSITEFKDNVLTNISQNAFRGATLLETIDLPNVKTILQYGFSGCSSLKSVNLPSVVNIYNCSFDNCGNLTSVNLPMLTTLSDQSFGYCKGLKSAKLPIVKTLNNKTFYYCIALETVDLSSVTSIKYYVFEGCSSLKTLILRSETMCALSSGTSFTGTAIENGTGYIYVPSALVDSYKTATSWKTYATQFRALEDYTVDGTITGELDESKI